MYLLLAILPNYGVLLKMVRVKRRESGKRGRKRLRGSERDYCKEMGMGIGRGLLREWYVYFLTLSPCLLSTYLRI